MPVLDSLERGILFTLTRLVTLVIIVVFCLPLAISGIVYYHFFGFDSHITYEDIHEELHPQSPIPYPKAASRVESPQTEAQETLPDSLQQYFDTPEAQQDFKNRYLAGLSTEDKRDYLDNLSEVVKRAQINGEDVPQVIQQYIQDKDRRIGRTPSDAVVLWGSRISLAIFTILTLILVAMASLILVLLAIERNTRQPREPRVKTVKASV